MIDTVTKRRRKLCRNSGGSADPVFREGCCTIRVGAYNGITRRYSHRNRMQPAKVLEVLFLLMLANGTPLFAAKLLGPQWSYPVDGYIRFVDGRRLLGSSKTVRGIVLATLVTAGGAALIDLGWQLGALVGSAAMAGDLFSSFVKRRFDMLPSSRALGLDQVPEALIPLIVCRYWLWLTLADIAVAMGLFFVGELVLSRVLFVVGLRDRPY